MDFPKLVSLLDRKALFFTRVHNLEDPFEGAWSNATLQLLEGTTLQKVVESDGYVVLFGNTTKYGLKLTRPYAEITDPKEWELLERVVSQRPSSNTRYSTYGGIEGSKVVHHIPTGHTFLILDGGEPAENQVGAIGYRLLGRDSTIEAARTLVNLWKPLMRFMMVNCWHESEYDSQAMWRVYAGGKYGIAIKTDMKSLGGCFVNRLPDAIVKVGYIPYDQEIIPLGLATPLLFKRPNFDYEREVRVVVTDLLEHQTTRKTEDPAPDVYLTDVDDEGRYYDVDPEQLIHEIVISPYAAPWMTELTRAVTKRYGLNVPVVQSSLSQKPPW